MCVCCVCVCGMLSVLCVVCCVCVCVCVCPCILHLYPYVCAHISLKSYVYIYIYAHLQLSLSLSLIFSLSHLCRLCERFALELPLANPSEQPTERGGRIRRETPVLRVQRLERDALQSQPLERLTVRVQLRLAVRLTGRRSTAR